MAKKRVRREGSDSLRRQAEKKASLMREDREALSPKAARRVLHELRVHQIELEMQNEELRRAQVELDAGRARYFDLYDAAPVGYLTLNEQRLIVEANLTASTLLGVARGALVNQPLPHFIFPEDQDIYYRHGRQLSATGTPQVCELRMLRAGVGPFWARIEATNAQGVDGMSICRAVVSDITESKWIEDAQLFLLQCGYQHTGEDFFKSLARYLAQCLAVSFVCIDRLAGDGLVAKTVAMYCDGEFKDNVEYALKETPCGAVLGKAICCFPRDVRRLFPRDAFLQELLAESYVGTTLWGFDGKPVGLIAVIGRKPMMDTHLAESLLSLVAVRAAGELERKRAEESLREADRRKDEFLAMLGHELRNPLAPIANAVDLLRSVGSANETQRRAHDMIDRQLTHLVRLVDDLLDVSRISHGKILLHKGVLDLVAVLGAVVEDYRPLLESNGLRLDLMLPHAPLPIEGDRARITQVVGNLLANAGKFTPKGGRVSVELALDGDGQARITVSDTGMGIEPELLSCIFQPFRQGVRSLESPRSGLGLGLALVQGLTELHGGRASVNSAGPGKGAQFSITLPVRSQRVGLQVSAPVPQVFPALPRRVLLIEDNRVVMDGLRMLLETDGHAVAVARTGRESIAMAKEFKPEVVISDISLGGGMDGHAVARALRQESEVAHAYLVAYSGFGQEDDRRASLAAGFDEHLTKPIRIESLRRVMVQTHGAETRGCGDAQTRRHEDAET